MPVVTRSGNNNNNNSGDGDSEGVSSPPSSVQNMNDGEIIDGEDGESQNNDGETQEQNESAAGEADNIGEEEGSNATINLLTQLVRELSNKNVMNDYLEKQMKIAEYNMSDFPKLESLDAEEVAEFLREFEEYEYRVQSALGIDRGRLVEVYFLCCKR